MGVNNKRKGVHTNRREDRKHNRRGNPKESPLDAIFKATDVAAEAMNVTEDPHEPVIVDRSRIVVEAAVEEVSPPPKRKKSTRKKKEATDE